MTMSLLITLVVEGPEPEDVKAGWGAFGIFLLLAVAVGLLGWSLVRQLRKAQGSADAGLYDPSPERPGGPGRGLRAQAPPVAQAGPDGPSDGAPDEAPDGPPEDGQR